MRLASVQWRPYLLDVQAGTRNRAGHIRRDRGELDRQAAGAWALGSSLRVQVPAAGALFYPGVGGVMLMVRGEAILG